MELILSAEGLSASGVRRSACLHFVCPAGGPPNLCLSPLSMATACPVPALGAVLGPLWLCWEPLSSCTGPAWDVHGFGLPAPSPWPWFVCPQEKPCPRMSRSARRTRRTWSPVITPRSLTTSRQLWPASQQRRNRNTTRRLPVSTGSWMIRCEGLFWLPSLGVNGNQTKLDGCAWVLVLVLILCPNWLELFFFLLPACMLSWICKRDCIHEGFRMPGNCVV